MDDGDSRGNPLIVYSNKRDNEVIEGKKLEVKGRLLCLGAVVTAFATWNLPLVLLIGIPGVAMTIWGGIRQWAAEE